MSVELFLWPYRDGEPARIPFSKVLSAFSNMIAHPSPQDGRLQLVNARGEIVCDIWVGDAADAEDHVGNVTVWDPTGDDMLWECIYRYLCSENVLLLWPGGDKLFAAVAGQETVEHLPADLVADIGTVKVVSSSADLLASVKAA